MIPAQVWYDFLNASALLLGDLHFGFRVGFETQFPNLPNLAILKTGGVSLGESLSALVVDAKRLTNMASYRLLVEADYATLSQHRNFKPLAWPSQPDGFFVGFILRLVRQSVGLHWNTSDFHARVSSPRAIPLGHLSKRSVSRTTRDVRFRFPSDWLPLGRENYQTRVSYLGEPVQTDFDALVSEDVARSVGDPNLKLEDLAKRLSVPKRVLQIKLAKKGQSFRQILLRVRISQACRLLRETDLSIAEIGFSVGYLEAPSFNRAFRRKMHTTPKQYRNAKKRTD